MTNSDADDPPQQLDHGCDHVVHHECVMCGREFQTTDVILSGGYCGSACRKMAWSLRRAEAAIGTDTSPVTRGPAPRPRGVMEPRSPTPAGIEGWLPILSCSITAGDCARP